MIPKLHAVPNGGAGQFFDKRLRLRAKKLCRDQSRGGLDAAVGRRWRSPQVSGVAVMKPTKSEAIAWFKVFLGIAKLPAGFVVEAF